jgi:hypothetical protein
VRKKKGSGGGRREERRGGRGRRGNMQGLSSQAVIVHTGMVCTDEESPLKSTVML